LQKIIGKIGFVLAKTRKN